MRDLQHPAISVVVPMYNCEQYVESMLGAIAAQTFKDFEVICVNDGSTDNTLSLIKDFCARDDRFTYISQKNGGAGSARNTGIDAASGKYMMFLDADDEYFPNFFREMYEAAEKHNADEVFCLYDDYDYRDGTLEADVGFKTEIFPEDTPVETETIPDLYNAVSWSVWNALLKKELIDRYSLRFSTTKAANDIFFIYAYASITKNILGVHKHLLRRRRNHNVNSITSNRWKHTEDVVSAVEELYSWIKSNNLSPSYLELCRVLFIRTIYYNCRLPYNEKYTEAMARCLCEGDMWKDVDRGSFYKKYWKRHETDEIKKRLIDLRETDSNTTVQAQWLSNRIHSIERIEEIAYKKYDRILNPKHYYKEVASIKSELAQLKKKNKEQEEKIKAISDALKKEKKNVEKEKRKVKQVKESRTYRAGKYVTWLPKKVYHGLGLGATKNAKAKKSDTVKVSVIVPVYNVEKYIKRCLDSLIDQTLKEIEFIIVDDCGQDNSMKIVREYQKRDPRIKILKNPSNIGVGPSRNRGIEAAKGEYLAFVDPDDWVSPNAYEALYKKAIADHADVAKGNVQVFDSEGKDITQEKKHFSNDVIKQRLSKGMPLFVALKSVHWAMIYSRQLIRNRSIQYGSTRSAQDGVFLLQVFLATSNISFCDEIVYHYCMRDDGLSTITSFNRHLAFLGSLKTRIMLLNKRGSFDAYYYQYIIDYTKYILNDFKNYVEGKEREKQSEIEKYLWNLEEAIDLSKDPQQVFDDLPGYSELRNLKYDGISSSITIQGEDFYSESLCLNHGLAKICHPERGLNSPDPDCTIPYFVSHINPDENMTINSFYIGSEAPEAEPVITKEQDRVIVNDSSGNRREIPLKGSGNIKVSVIIPVYNAEKYIRRCLDSLVNQTLKELEFIFVDDCGQDNSMAIVEEYQKRDPRIIILRNPSNCGEGATKNRGIEMAQGNYLSFVDSDDYVALNFYELLYAAATKNGTHDIAKGVRKKVGEDGNELESVDHTLNKQIASLSAKKKSLYTEFFYEHTTAIYRRTLFKDSRVRFGTTYSASDTTFLLRCCYQTNDIVLEEAAVYYYVQREGSLTQGSVVKRAHGEADALAEKTEFLKEKGIDDEAMGFLLSKANYRYKRVSELHNEGLVSDEDYASFSEKYADIIRDIPGGIESCEKYILLKKLLLASLGCK